MMKSKSIVRFHHTGTNEVQCNFTSIGVISSRFCYANSRCDDRPFRYKILSQPPETHRAHEAWSLFLCLPYHYNTSKNLTVERRPETYYNNERIQNQVEFLLCYDEIRTDRRQRSSRARINHEKWCNQTNSTDSRGRITHMPPCCDPNILCFIGRIFIFEHLLDIIVSSYILRLRLSICRSCIFNSNTSNYRRGTSIY